ncbi:molybdate ABC transporter substrate-binding protein [Haloimpatiens sp. FM7330]|uniref:molybdate ABC transporter substrate-binding protein n=1 Tax=Haloimpatiens sp. FM7330 TaxID=3298610 RepID=UPI003638242F
MKRKIFLGIFIIVALFGLIGCSSNKETKEITISAAASLKEPIEEIKNVFEKEKNIKLNINIGSSGALQKQIEQGAPVDVFISASKKQMNALKEKDLIDKNSEKDMFTNSLVLIVSNSYKKDIKSIDKLKGKDIKIAIGETSTVPAGQYAKEALQNLKYWNEFNNKFVYAKNVKAVLNYVEKGEAEAGIVYYTDAVNLKNSYVAYKVPQSSHKEIIYPSAILSQSKNKELSNEFIKYLNNKKCRDILKKYNFEVKEN